MFGKHLTDLVKIILADIGCLTELYCHHHWWGDVSENCTERLY